jgi:hypothetical protein
VVCPVKYPPAPPPPAPLFQPYPPPPPPEIIKYSIVGFEPAFADLYLTKLLIPEVLRL